jgi:talin
MLRKEMLDQIEIVSKKVIVLLQSFQTSAKGTQACINADNSVNGIIADLNTVIMFATSGTLKSESESDTFGNHRESILRSAKTLVEDTKSLVSTSGSVGINQDELAVGVQTSVKTIIKLSDAIKLGAASLGSDQPDAQVLLINAVKDVASALSELIGTIKLVSSGSINKNSTDRQSSLDYSASLLSESAKNMVTNVQSLLKTVKTVEDEAARGTRALESAIEAIYQEIKLYSSFINDSKCQSRLLDEADQSNSGMNPEDLIKATKQITLATSKAIGAANSLRQEDIITAANMGRKAVSDLLFVSRGAKSNSRQSAGTSEDQPQQIQILSVGLNCSIFYKELLECIQMVSFKILNQKNMNF